MMILKCQIKTGWITNVHFFGWPIKHALIVKEPASPGNRHVLATFGLSDVKKAPEIAHCERIFLFTFLLFLLDLLLLFLISRNVVQNEHQWFCRCPLVLMKFMMRHFDLDLISKGFGWKFEEKETSQANMAMIRS